MLIDSYESPAAQSLLPLGRERHDDGGRAQRLLRTEAAGAAVFIVAAVLLAALATSARHFSLPALAVMMVTYVIARRVQYPVGSAWTAPTQLVFVPMLFVLPMPFVPLVVAACSVLERLPKVARGHLGPTRLLAAVGDSFYALGAGLVLVLGRGPHPQMVRGRSASLRAAADAVALRHRRQPFLRGAADRRIGGRTAGPGAARPPAHRLDGAARAWAAGAAGGLARPGQRGPGA